MAVGLENNIQTYLESDEVSTRLLVEIELDKDTVYRFIADDSISEVEIDGKIYQSASISRGAREENADNSIESISLTLSNKWQEWAAIMANQGNTFLGKKCVLLEWFPDFPDDPPVVMYNGVLDDIKMSASTFSLKVVRVLGDYEQTSPLMTYDVNCQYVFKDNRCRYAGNEFYSCGKTLTECKLRNNVLNFGGFPSVPKEFLINKGE